jgi:hypothetical protein
MNPMAKKIPKTTIPLSFSSSTHQLNPNVAKKSDNKDMGKPFGKASTCLRVAASAKAGANL